MDYGMRLFRSVTLRVEMTLNPPRRRHEGSRSISQRKRLGNMETRPHREACPPPAGRVPSG